MSALIEFLVRHQSDRGKMAILRKGLIPSQVHYTWPLLYPFLDFGKSYRMKVVQTIAGLYAHHPKNIGQGNFGDLCNSLLDSEERKKIQDGESGSISKHFQYVIAADGEEIFARVSRLIRRAKRDEIPVNYQQLLEDLYGWNTYRRESIKTQWGMAFWHFPKGEKNAESCED